MEKFFKVAQVKNLAPKGKKDCHYSCIDDAGFLRKFVELAHNNGYGKIQIVESYYSALAHKANKTLKPAKSGTTDLVGAFLILISKMSIKDANDISMLLLRLVEENDAEIDKELLF